MISKFSIVCGTCRYYLPSESEYEEELGNCTTPLPKALFGGEMNMMEPTEGRGCDTWESKEGSQYIKVAPLRTWGQD